MHTVGRVLISDILAASPRLCPSDQLRVMVTRNWEEMPWSTGHPGQQLRPFTAHS